jgi:hypothetical protein
MAYEAMFATSLIANEVPASVTPRFLSLFVSYTTWFELCPPVACMNGDGVARKYVEMIWNNVEPNKYTWISWKEF